MNHTRISALTRWKLLVALLGIALLASASPAAQAGAGLAAPISSDIITNTTWTSANNPYQVSAPIKVASGVTLTIEPGVEVRFAASAGLRVEGSLVARGTQAQQIRMLGENNGSWQGLAVAQPTGNVLLESITIVKAANGLSLQPPLVALGKTNSRIDVINSRFDSNSVAVDANYSVLTDAPRLVLRNNLFINNTIGLRVNSLLEGNSKPRFNHNSFIGNSIAVSGLNLTGQGLKMQQQWWGSADGPVQGTSAQCANPPLLGALLRGLICGLVDFTPWSRAETGRAVVQAGQAATLTSAIGTSALADDDSLSATSALTVTVPTGAFTQTVDLLAAPTDSTAAPPGQLTDIAFEITAAANGSAIHQFANSQQLTLEIHYTSDDLNGADPAKLVLFYYDEALGSWSTAGIISTPDLANQRMIVQLSHLSRFRTSSVSDAPETQRTWLPFARR